MSLDTWFSLVLLWHFCTRRTPIKIDLCKSCSFIWTTPDQSYANLGMLTSGNRVILVQSTRFSPQIVKYRRESSWQFRERLTPYIGRFISVNAGRPRFRGSVCLSLTSDTMSHHHPWRLKTRRRYDGILYARDISRYIEFNA